MTDNKLRELERLRQLYLEDPMLYGGNYIAALERALWRQLPRPGVLGGFSWRQFGWMAQANEAEGEGERGE